ncbi:MAG: hypothetical protein ABJF23_29430 [Bryobacteraceae bacterium]
MKSESLSLENSLAAAVTAFSYDKNGNLVQQDNQDLLAVPLVDSRQILNTYYPLTPAAVDGAAAADNANAYWNPSAPHLRNLPKTSQVCCDAAPNNTRVSAFTEWCYDSAPTCYSGAASSGNAIEVRHWDNTRSATPTVGLTASTASITVRTYDPSGSGNVWTVTDPSSNVTKFEYDPMCNSSSLYPSRIISAYNSSPAVARTRGVQYDCNSGLAQSESDVNNSINTSYSYDVFGRQTLRQESGGALIRKSTTQYDDVSRIAMNKSDLNFVNDGLVTTITHYDPLGRVRLVRTNDQDGTPPVFNNESTG